MGLLIYFVIFVVDNGFEKIMKCGIMVDWFESVVYFLSKYIVFILNVNFSISKIVFMCEVIRLN